MESELGKKVKQSIRLLKLFRDNYDEEIELAYSGGKDSDVILALTKLADIKVRPIYKDTTIAPVGTKSHVREMGVEIRKPKRNFFEILKNKGYPTRFRRFCCSELKEYKILDKVIIGIRAEESTRRKERYKEPTECRVYNKKERVEIIYPILDYTLKDVAEFVNYYNVKLAPCYYRDDGSIDFTKRLGCVGCPLKSDCGRSDMKNNPHILIAWLKAGHLYLEKRGRVNYCSNAYQMLAAHLFYQDKMRSFHSLVNNPLFPQDWKELLEDYFEVRLPNLI